MTNLHPMAKTTGLRSGVRGEMLNINDAATWPITEPYNSTSSNNDSSQGVGAVAAEGLNILIFSLNLKF